MSTVTPDTAELVARYASEGQQMERQGEHKRAVERWKQALALLPKESAQAVWIREHIKQIEASHPEAQGSQWIKRLGPLAPIALFIAKFKFILIFLLKFKFLLSLFAFFGLYWAEFGWKFALGFTALIFVHEMGHFVDVKRRGLPAEMPVFLPGLGAYVKWQALNVSEEDRAEISLAGPFAGLLAAIACAAVWWYSGGSAGTPTQTGSLFAALAAIGAWLNAINLIPVYILDGGQAIHSLDRNSRIALVVISAAIGYITGQLTFYVIAAGAVYTVYTAMKHKDEPAQSSTKILFYYTALLASLALLMHSLPSQGALNR